MECSKRCAGLSSDSRPSPGGNGCRYLQCSTEAATSGFLLLSWVHGSTWQRASAATAEGLWERPESTAQPCCPQQGQLRDNPGNEHEAVGCLPGPSSVLSVAISPWDGMGREGSKMAVAISPVAQLCHSPSCTGWNGCGSSGCLAGAASAPFFFFLLKTLKRLRNLPAMPRAGLEGTFRQMLHKSSGSTSPQGHLQKRSLG